jgi:hypothetical protein
MTAILNGECILKKGWLASLMGFVVSLGRPFSAHLPAKSRKSFCNANGKKSFER